jgi:hypothetical protein
LLHRRDHDNLVCLATIVLMLVALGGLAVCVRRLRQATCTVALVQLRTLAGPALLALSAACFATLPSIWYASIRNSAPPDLDVSALEAIALDPNPGLAFLLLVATATLVLLYCSVVLATGVGIVNRNSAVLRGVGEAPRTRAVVAEPSGAEPPPIMAIPVGVGVAAVRQAPLAGGIDELQMARATASHPILPWRALRSVTAAARELPPNRRQRSKREVRGVLNLNPFGVLAGGTLVIALMVVPDLVWGDVRLTVFGPLASRVALLAITATSLCSMILLACSLGMARRISGVSRYLATARKNSSAEGNIGRWPADLHGPRIFPPTPVVARAADGGSVANWLLWEASQEQWRERVSGWLHLGKSDGEHLTAIFVLLATELSVFRWSAVGSVLCALASVATVYLFPIEADSLLMFNLLLLLGVGAIAGFAATTFERDTLMSNVLCNRPAPRKFSTPLFVFISVPFVALAVAVAITELPGVIDWSGGVLQLLVALGLHP